jgi:Flp pilus assembly protein TadD
MRHHSVIALALIGAAFLLPGCSTNPVDPVATTAIAPQSGDIGATDLRQGKAQFRQANYGLAEEHFRKAVELQADDAEAWMGLAACYDQLGRFDFADRAYDQLLKIAGRQPRVLNNMGYSQLLRGNKAKARKLLLEAEQGMPGDKLVEANLALLNKG